MDLNDIATMADMGAIELADVPDDLPASTYEMIRTTAERHPGAPALTFFLRAQTFRQAEQWSYADLLARIHQCANLFHSLGANKDSVIAFILPNLPETHWVIWGGETAGIVAAINPLLEPTAIAELLRTVGASILVTLAPFPDIDLWQKMAPVLGDVPSLRHVLLVNLADRVLGWRRPLARLMQRRASRQAGGTAITARNGSPLVIQDFGRALAAQPSDRLLSARRIDLEDYGSFFCTGGTTGVPKIAMRRQRNEVSNVRAIAQFFGDNLGFGKTIYCGLPLFHVNAVIVTGLVPFSQGAHVVLGTPQGYRGEGVVVNFWRIVEHFRVNFFSGVPTLFGSLLQVPVNGQRIDSLEYAICGAAAMPRELFRRFQDATGLKILEGYGLTEAACASSLNPPRGERRLGSIGLPLPGQAMKAVLLDAQGNYRRDCAPDEVGVLAIDGPNVFAGYKIAEQNEGLWIDAHDGRRWLNTGDLGYCDSDGYFWLTGRSKELIIRGGHNIDPAMIEEPLHSHPAVQVAAAIGRPDMHAGELPVAYVQLKPGAQANEAELLMYLAKHISERAALPKAVIVLDEIPLTPVGKIYKPALKRREIEYALGKALSEASVRFEQVTANMGAGRHGVVVTVQLASGQAREPAQSTLGMFPFALEFKCASTAT